jgi:hypothetical protein
MNKSINESHSTSHHLFKMSEPFIVTQDEVPTEKTNLNSDMHLFLAETKVLNNHPLLSEVLNSGKAVFTAIKIKRNQLMSYSLEKSCLLMVNAGLGEIIYNNGSIRKEIKAGDIVIMPPSFDCEIIGESESSLEILLISKGLDLLKNNDSEEAYQEIIRYNQVKLDKLLKLPLIKFIENPDKITPEQAQTLLNCIQVFSRTFQRMMFIRQSTCDDPIFKAKFLKHFEEEFGHDTLLEDNKNTSIMADPTLNAILSWFPYQMFLVDNVSKAALVHLVWEVIGDNFHTLAKPLGKYTQSNYFELHEEADELHADLGYDLIKNQSPLVYNSLKDLLDLSWEIFSAEFDRVSYLVNHTKTNLKLPN